MVIEKLSKSGVPLVLLVFLLTVLLGLAPEPHVARRDLQLARRALDYGEPLLAAEHLAHAADRMPGADLWALAGRYAWQGEDSQAAVEYLQRARSLEPEDRVLLGDAYRQTGELQAAEAIWQAVSQETGPSVEVYRRLLDLHLETGDYPAAMEDLRALTALRPEDAGLRFQLGLLVASQQPEKALGHLEQAASLDPQLKPAATALQRRIVSARRGDSPAYSLLAAGRALADLGHWNLAAEAFRRATEARPDYAEAWAYLGEARQHIPVRQSETAGWEELQRALELDPDSVAARSFLALYWERRGDFSAAVAAYQAALDREPENPVLHASYARQQARLGDLNQALESYRRAVELAPRDAEFLGYLVDFSLEYQVDVTGIALPAARRAVILNPRNPETLVRMARVFLKLEDEESAERFLNRALRLEPDHPEVHLGFGMLRLLRGDFDGARQALDRVRDLAPDSPAAGHSQRLLEAYFP